MRAAASVALVLVALLGGGLLPPAPGQEKRNKEKEKHARVESGSRTEYYKKWLREDVTYIITDEEKNVFKDLATDEEKGELHRAVLVSPRPRSRTSENEFKDEHYRRIAFANERFPSGIPGWKTDRGRIYITFGPPAEIESHPSGGSYNREIWEGGGQTSTFPFERWRYRHIDGIGDDIEIEFVDKSMTGEYRIALSPDEKDALLFVPNAGLTWREEMGLSSKQDRPYSTRRRPTTPRPATCGPRTCRSSAWSSTSTCSVRRRSNSRICAAS